MDNFERIRDAIAVALAVDAEDIKRDTNLILDLGAESIDFLDIIFRLEKEFDIKIPRGEIERRTRGAMSDEEFAVNGRLTDAALEQIRIMMPEVPVDAIVSGLMVRDIPRLMTAASFERIVEEQISKRSESPRPAKARVTDSGRGTTTHAAP